MAIHNTVAAALACLPEEVRRDPRLVRHAVWERLAAPELEARFPVAWMDDRGRAQVRSGYFAGPPDAPVTARFRAGMDADETPALALLRRMQSALLGQSPPAAAGLDIDPGELSDGESMRVCRAFRDALPTRGPLRTAGLPPRERGYLAGRDPAAPAALSAEEAAGVGLGELARELMRRLAGRRMEGMRVLVLGTGPDARAAADALVRQGCVPVPPGTAAELVFLCGEGPAEGAALPPPGAAAVFEGRFLAAPDDAVRRLRERGVLFVPALLAGAGGAMALPDGDRWEAARFLRREMRRLAAAALDAGDGDPYRGAYAAALTAEAGALLRRGI